MSPKRYHMFKWLHRMELPTFLLILILVLFVRSVEGSRFGNDFYAIWWNCGIFQIFYYNEKFLRTIRRHHSWGLLTPTS